MIFYRLALQRIIEYFQLNTPSEEELQRQILLHKRPKEVYKTKLKTDRTLNLYISVLLSIIGILINISIPFASVESPCQVLKERKLFFLYEVAKVIEAYSDVLDYFIVVFLVMLVYVSMRTILDAIKRTKINISPWIERGKYTLPPGHRNKRKESIF